MKKVFAILAALVLICSAAVADVDLSGMSYEELAALRDQLNKAIWESKEWAGVSIPQGTYTIGEDIPAGHWTVRAAPKSVCTVTYCEKLDELGAADWSGKMKMEALSAEDTYGFDPTNDLSQTDFDMQEGWHVVVEMGGVIFSPYSGKPAFDFSF